MWHGCGVREHGGWFRVQVSGRLSDGPDARLHRRERVRSSGCMRGEREMHQRARIVQVYLPPGFHRSRTNTVRKSVII